MQKLDKIPELKTENLVLKAITVDDLEELQEILSYRIGEQPLDDPFDKLKRIDEDFAIMKTVNWGIYLNDELIGSCGYYRGFENNTGEVGYVMREKYRGKGFMSKAVSTIVNFGFDVLCLKRITAYTGADNKASIGMLSKLGFKKSQITHPELEVFEIFNS